MSESNLAVFVLGMIAGICLMCIVFAITDENTQLIQKCEETLPRNQHCKLIAVPEVPSI